MGDRIPRELLPRDPNDNRFSRGRDGGGGGRSYGGRDGGGGRRPSSGGYRRGDSSNGGGNSSGGYRDRNDDRTPRFASRGEDRPAAPSPVTGYRPQRSAAATGPTEQRTERSERSERSSGGGGERREHSGIKRFRGPKKQYRD